MAARRFPVEAGAIQQFARAIGDTNPIYSDAEFAQTQPVGGLVAPPTFGMAADHYDPDYNRRPQPGVKWFGSGRQAIGSQQGVFNKDGGSGFHAEQIFEYHRPIRAGDELTVETFEGRRWEKEGRRGGSLVFSETVTEMRDASGELVLTARFIGVSTEKPVR